jgi:hypothetical protein
VLKAEDLLERQLIKILDVREHLPPIDALAVQTLNPYRGFLAH